MTNHKCWVCGERDFKELLRFGRQPSRAQELPRSIEEARDAVMDLEIVECRSCGVAQRTGRPLRYCGAALRSTGLSEALAAQRLKQLKALVAGIGNSSKIIGELGSGDGGNLELMEKAGADLTVGINYEMREGACGEPVCFRTCTVDGLYPAWSAFCTFNYLEHLPNPKQALADLRRVLRPGAIGIVEVPDFAFIVENNMLFEFTAEHLCYFSRSTLTALLELAGFKVMEASRAMDGYVMSLKVQAKPEFSWNMRYAASELIGQIYNFCQGCESVVVWGAGHQALSLVATDTPPRLKYIVDSAASKQGRYAPGAAVPIEPPSRLESDPPGAIIVACAGYNKEVLDIVLGSPALSKVKVAAIDGMRLEAVRC